MLARFFGPRRHRRLRLLLSSYLDGEVTEKEARRLEEHLSTCEECQWELESLRATVSLLRKVPSPAPSRFFALREEPSPPLRNPGYVLAMRAATSVAALLLVALLAGDLTGLLSQGGGVSREAAPRDMMVPDQFEAAPLASPAPAPTAVAGAPAPEEGPELRTPQDQLQEREPKSLTTEKEMQEPGAVGTPAAWEALEEAGGLSLPLWQLEVALGGGAVLLAGAWVWMTLRMRRRPLL